ncbi:multiubiquitin domain-containing protein [Prosthecobacter sp.]|uniref:multiubiquitin domain-containing protein n=1 Tax=Prosthecobacter sp. TaxID=1965333 RepID=UPI003783A56B
MNDENVYAPSRRVKALVLKTQAGVPPDHVIVRDHDSGRDVAYDDQELLDLAEGNVFVAMPPCEFTRHSGCVGRPKLAWFVDDRPEITLVSEQTSDSIRGLFSLSTAVDLFRDSQSPVDEVTASGTFLKFDEGPVFYTRGKGCEQKEITIYINTEPKKTKLAVINYEQVIALAYPTLPVGNDVHFTVNYRKGPPENSEGLLVEDGTPVKLKEGMRFDVSPNDRS